MENIRVESISTVAVLLASNEQLFAHRSPRGLKMVKVVVRVPHWLPGRPKTGCNYTVSFQNRTSKERTQ